MAKHQVTRPILKDGDRYDPGVPIELTAEEADNLEASGAIIRGDGETGQHNDMEDENSKEAQAANRKQRQSSTAPKK